jgi:hypothetical protein
MKGQRISSFEHSDRAFLGKLIRLKLPWFFVVGIFSGIALSARGFIRERMGSNTFGVITIFFASIWTYFILTFSSWDPWPPVPIPTFEFWGFNVMTLKEIIIFSVPLLGLFHSFTRDIDDGDVFGESLFWQWSGFEGDYASVVKKYAWLDAALFLVLASLFYFVDIYLAVFFAVSGLIMAIEEHFIIYQEFDAKSRREVQAKRKEERRRGGGNTKKEGAQSGRRRASVITKEEQQKYMRKK